jgi:hypothetical protein
MWINRIEYNRLVQTTKDLRNSIDALHIKLANVRQPVKNYLVTDYNGEIPISATGYQFNYESNMTEFHKNGLLVATFKNVVRILVV